PGKFGFVTLHNLLSCGYRGDVFAVGRGEDTILGQPVLASVDAVPDGAANSDVCVTESELATLKLWVDGGLQECDGECVLDCGEGAYSLDGETCLDCEPCPINQERWLCGGLVNSMWGPGTCNDCPNGMYKDVIGEWDTPCDGSGYKLVTHTMEWTPPPGVTNVWVRVVGGGGGGASHHGGGGGGGEHKSGYFTVDGPVTAMVGYGGAGAWGTWSGPKDGYTGGISSFGGLLNAMGGKGGTTGNATNSWNGAGGNGGYSGGGGANSAGNPGCPGGDLGSDAPMCLPAGVGGYDMNGSEGQGYFTKVSAFGGAGGAGGTSWYPGGGGGGGIILGPSAQAVLQNLYGSLTENSTEKGGDGSEFYSGKGGQGFGAGGGAGGDWTSDDEWAHGGDGADGFVYIEW
ncbi:MAG: hypothetical protein QF464_11940, partial [Myxococcota bacterium]|nr:hypothetical protein [Myxococcota bacterium]